MKSEEKSVRSETFDPKVLSGRNRRLLHEWQTLETRLQDRPDVSCRVVGRNTDGLPNAYLVNYQLLSICGVALVEQLGEPGVKNPPLFAKGYQMRIDLPQGYPSVDAPPAFRFLTHDETGMPIAHPWHPNIRYFGDFAGRVCLNMVDTYTELAWAVDRVGEYLCYDLYHAVAEPPYPEDMQVAAWVIRQGEPNGWIFFSQDNNEIEV